MGVAFLYESDYRLGVYREVESGNLDARILLPQLRRHDPNRFVWGSTRTFSGTNRGGGLNASAAVPTAR